MYKWYTTWGPLSRIWYKWYTTWVPLSRICYKWYTTWVPLSRICYKWYTTWVPLSRICYKWYTTWVPLSEYVINNINDITCMGLAVYIQVNADLNFNDYPDPGFIILRKIMHTKSEFSLKMGWMKTSNKRLTELASINSNAISAFSKKQYWVTVRAFYSYHILLIVTVYNRSSWFS